MNSKDLYIDLILKSIMGKIYPDETGYKHEHNFPQYAHTMLDISRLMCVVDCMKSIIENKIEGDVIETGVWRGGTTILMRAILKAYGVTDKTVYVADSFEGLPHPDVSNFPKDEGDDNWNIPELSVSLDQVKSNFKVYGLLDKQVVFIKGYFEETIKTVPAKKFALLRLDGDMYGSTWSVLDALYPKLQIGGFCIIDDYSLWRARWAMEDYRKLHKIEDELIFVDCSAYWKKTK